MIELNKKTQQDFLNREWVQRLLDAGVDMSDAYYYLHNNSTGDCFILAKELADNMKEKGLDGSKILPTYTVSELLYKLHEWIYPTIDGEEYSGGLRFLKDAPFYIWYYKLINEDQTKADENYIYAEAEYPIESLASLLIQCHKKDIGIKAKDTGNISDK